MERELPILVTGAAGVVGSIACRALAAAGHTLRALDLRPAAGVADSMVGSITDPLALNRAAAGCRCIVHLAATPDDADFLGELLPNNIAGVYHVLEAARRQGVGRVILASSIQVVAGMRWPAGRVGRLDDGTAPANGYAVTKLFAENLGQVFARRHKLAVVAARIGWLPRTRQALDELRSSRGAQSVYLSHADAGRFLACAVAAPMAGYQVMFVTSLPPAGSFGWDPEPARAATGFVARDTYPDGCAFP